MRRRKPTAGPHLPPRQVLCGEWAVLRAYAAEHGLDCVTLIRARRETRLAELHGREPDYSGIGPLRA